MWFLDNAGYLGRITAAGAIREFAVGKTIRPLSIYFVPSRPIIAGRDGSIWGTCQYGGQFNKGVIFKMIVR